MENDGENNRIEQIRAWIIEQIRSAGARDLLILERVVAGITG